MIVERDAEKGVELVIPQLHHVFRFPLLCILDFRLKIIYRFQHNVSRCEEGVARGIVGKYIPVC